MFNRGLSPRTIEYTNAVRQSAFRQAVHWKMLAEDPCVGVDLPRLKRREVEALSVEECRRFLTVARESEWYALFALALTTGMRPSELAAVAIPVEQVHVTFDRNQDIEHNATAIYDFILHSKKAITRHFLADTVAFACRRTVGIQVADLFARETMKYLDGQIGGVARPRRGSFIALSETKRIRLKAHGKYVFEDKKRRLGGAYTDRASLSEYRKWLDKNRLQNCLSNRVVHLKEFPELWDNKS